MKPSNTSLLSFLFIFLFSFSGTAFAGTENEFFQCLSSYSQNFFSISTLIYTPNNSSYQPILLSSAQNLRPYSSPLADPLAIITPLYESQIQEIVQCSKLLRGVEIRVRSGGHDYEGLSYISKSPFVIVDLENLRSITINTENNTLWVQAGATLGELYYSIAKKSRTLAFPAGVCPTVGVGGHFSGGGFGMISRKYGLAIDNIIDARIIDVNGKILDRESMGEDLFWAIRGGGGASFGIILAWKINLVSVPQNLTVFNVTRTLEQNVTKLVHRWQYIADKIDENLVIRLFLRSVNSSQNGHKTIQVFFTAMFVGGVNTLLRVMQESFPELGLLREDCIEMSWIESILYMAEFPRGSPLDVLLNRTQRVIDFFKGKSDYATKPISEKGLLGIWERLYEEVGLAELQFTPYGGRMNEISESELPFPHRSGNIYMIHYRVGWGEEGVEAQRHMSWIRKLYNYMALYVSKSPRAAYLNYRDLDLGVNNEGKTSYAKASIWGTKYFKNNFHRLVQVKTKVDPANFFRNEQSIPSLSSGWKKGGD
ncbi:hypothetical protein LguiA_008220 [Lonicera macranthoides]